MAASSISRSERCVTLSGIPDFTASIAHKRARPYTRLDRRWCERVWNPAAPGGGVPLQGECAALTGVSPHAATAAVNVVDPEPDAFHVKGVDGAHERLALLDNPGSLRPGRFFNSPMRSVTPRRRRVALVSWSCSAGYLKSTAPRAASATPPADEKGSERSSYNEVCWVFRIACTTADSGTAPFRSVR